MASITSKLILRQAKNWPGINTISSRMIARKTMAPKRAGKHYRLWAVPGDRVAERDVLAKQYTVKWHPGINAGIDEDRTIYSLVDGTMIITEERFNPDRTHPLVDQIYGPEEDNMTPLIKRYIHVIPDRRIPEFKLVDVI